MKSAVEINRWLVLVNSASSGLTHVLNISVLVWLHQYLLRRISPEEYSIYPVVIGIIALVPMLTSVLLGGLGRYVVEAYARSDDRRVTEIVSTMFPLLAAAGLVVLGLCLPLAWGIDRVLNIPAGRVNDARIMLMLLAGSAALRLMLTPFGLGLYARQKFIVLNLIKLGGQLVRLGILLILLLGVSTRIVWVAVAAASADICVGVVQTIVSRRLIPALRLRRRSFRPELARELTSFGAWNTVMQLGALVPTTIHPLILNKLATAMDVTCFGIGVMLLREIQIATQTVIAPLHPPLTAMHAAQDRAGLARAFVRGSRYALWAILLVVPPLVIYRREWVNLYIGESYSLAASVIGCLLVVLPFNYSTVMLGPLAFATARLRPVAIRLVSVQLTNLCVALYLVGIMHRGAMGAAVAMLVVGLILRPLLFWPLAWRMSDISAGRWLRQTVGPGVLPGVAGIGVWLVLRHVVTPESWIELGGCFAAGVAIYLAVLVVACLQPYERQDLRLILRALWMLRPWQVRQAVGHLLGSAERDRG